MLIWQTANGCTAVRRNLRIPIQTLAEIAKFLLTCTVLEQKVQSLQEAIGKEMASLKTQLDNIHIFLQQELAIVKNMITEERPDKTTEFEEMQLPSSYVYKT